MKLYTVDEDGLALLEQMVRDLRGNGERLEPEGRRVLGSRLNTLMRSIRDRVQPSCAMQSDG